uniref:Ig-like domain-containing protein n=1 Tax=Leptobrachium leishanense TaxID=445787 RepID=A0A8C5QTX0_9ANUR
METHSTFPARTGPGVIICGHIYSQLDPQIKRISSLYVACVTELFPPPRVSISVDPVVEGAEMRVTCATLPQRAKTSLEFAFNRNGRKVQEFSSSDTYSVQSAQEDDAGNYTCEAKTSSSSHLFFFVSHPESFSRPQIKVSPDQVTEGDTVTMMCSAVNTKQEFAFYRNGQEVQGFGPSGEYQVQSVQEGDTGSYTCQVTYLPNGLKKRSDAHHVYVKELFSFPVLTITPAQVTEGDTMTVTCDAALRTSAGNNTQLEFAFSRDGGDLRGFTVSNKYHVDTAQTQDAGNYSCEARTPTNKVRKKSHVTNVHISGECGMLMLCLFVPPPRSHAEQAASFNTIYNRTRKPSEYTLCAAVQEYSFYGLCVCNMTGNDSQYTKYGRTKVRLRNASGK